MPKWTRLLRSNSHKVAKSWKYENYYAKFRNILSPKQVLKIYQSERDLQSKMRMEKQHRNFGKGRFHGDKIRTKARISVK